MLIYGLPLIGLVAGAITGKVISEEYFKGFDSDASAALIGFTALYYYFSLCKKLE